MHYDLDLPSLTSSVQVIYLDDIVIVDYLRQLVGFARQTGVSGSIQMLKNVSMA